MLKRSLDVLIAVLGLLLFGPLMMCVAVAVRLRLGTPVLFRQVRPGLHGKPFVMLKFRSMLDACDANGKPLPDSQRLPPFGCWLRASSLDELPELWNILKGDMSVVGPRPLLMSYLPLYSERQMRRHEVRPGITGWAQINGRNAISWEQKFELDVWYVENRTLWLDIKIFFLTFAKVAGQSGINESGQVTMTAFTGTPGSAAAQEHKP